MIHALKTTRGYFEDSAAGIKSFEVRKNDRLYSLGDYVALNEVSGGELIESVRSESGVPIYERDKLDYSSK